MGLILISAVHTMQVCMYKHLHLHEFQLIYFSENYLDVCTSLVGNQPTGIDNSYKCRQRMKGLIYVMFKLLDDLFFCAVDLMKAGSTVILRNAKIDMFKGSMRLAVDKWGRVEVTEPADFVVKEDNNLSLVEYELVNVVEE